MAPFISLNYFTIIKMLKNKGQKTSRYIRASLIKEVVDKIKSIANLFSKKSIEITDFDEATANADYLLERSLENIKNAMFKLLASWKDLFKKFEGVDQGKWTKYINKITSEYLTKEFLAPFMSQLDAIVKKKENYQDLLKTPETPEQQRNTTEGSEKDNAPQQDPNDIKSSNAALQRDPNDKSKSPYVGLIDTSKLDDDRLIDKSKSPKVGLIDTSKLDALLTSKYSVESTGKFKSLLVMHGNDISRSCNVLPVNTSESTVIADDKSKTTQVLSSDKSELPIIGQSDTFKPSNKLLGDTSESPIEQSNKLKLIDEATLDRMLDVISLLIFRASE
jgi:hypothetical protein